MKSCGAFETAASGEDDASIHAHANTRVARLFGTLAAESMLERDAIYCAVFPPGARHQASNSLSLSLPLSMHATPSRRCVRVECTRRGTQHRKRESARILLRNIYARSEKWGGGTGGQMPCNDIFSAVRAFVGACSTRTQTARQRPRESKRKGKGTETG